MKYLIIIFVFFLISLEGFTQKTTFSERINFGISGGTTYYVGDINTLTPFYKSRFSYGGRIIYNFNKRYAIKINVLRGNIRGNDNDFSISYQQQIRKKSFRSSFIDGSLQIEFNFLPYLNTTKFKYNYSFYATAGLGFTGTTQSTINTQHYITLPFGGGFKYNIFERTNIGVEWTYRKTFTDQMDDISNPNNSEYNSSIHNKDWYSFAGFFITYKLFNQPGDCPAYWNKNE